MFAAVNALGVSRARLCLCATHSGFPRAGADLASSISSMGGQILYTLYCVHAVHTVLCKLFNCISCCLYAGADSLLQWGDNKLYTLYTVLFYMWGRWELGDFSKSTGTDLFPSNVKFSVQHAIICRVVLLTLYKKGLLKSTMQLLCKSNRCVWQEGFSKFLRVVELTQWIIL